MTQGKDNDDTVISGYTILAVISFVIGGVVDKYILHHEPPVMLLFSLFCLFLMFDTLNGIKNKIKKLERKLDDALEKLSKR